MSDPIQVSFGNTNHHSAFDQFMTQWLRKAVQVKSGTAAAPPPSDRQVKFQLGEPDADGWMARTMWIWK